MLLKDVHKLPHHRTVGWWSVGLAERQPPDRPQKCRHYFFYHLHSHSSDEMFVAKLGMLGAKVRHIHKFQADAFR